MAAVSLVSYGAGAFGAWGSPTRARTMAFASLITAQLLHARACRAHTDKPNPELSWAIAASFGLQAVAVGVPAVARVLGGAPLGLVDISVAFGLGAVPALLREGRNFLSPGAIVVRREDMTETRRLDDEVPHAVISHGVR